MIPYACSDVMSFVMLNKKSLYKNYSTDQFLAWVFTIELRFRLRLNSLYCGQGLYVTLVFLVFCSEHGLSLLTFIHLFLCLCCLLSFQIIALPVDIVNTKMSAQLLHSQNVKYQHVPSLAFGHLDRATIICKGGPA